MGIPLRYAIHQAHRNIWHFKLKAGQPVMNDIGKGGLARFANSCTNEIQGTHSFIIVKVDMPHSATCPEQLSANCSIGGSIRASLSH